MTRERGAVGRAEPVAMVVGLLVLLVPLPASAHTLQGDADTRLPFAAYLIGAAVAVALSFAFVAISDGTPVAEPPPGRLRTLPGWLRLALRGVGLAARVESGRPLGVVLIGYTIVTVAGMAVFGRDRWREHGEVFGVWFGLLGRVAPQGLEGPAAEGRVRRRRLGSALASSPWSSSLLAVVAVGVGSVIWDGLSQTQPYADVVGDPSLLVETLLLIAFLGLVTGMVLVVARRVGAAAAGAGLVPVATGYVVAHYLGYLLVEGQRIMVALSDPLQQGWDLLGTASWEPWDAWLATSALWTIQVGAVVLGHVAGAWLGHAAVMRTRHESKTASQWPLAALMIGLTVLALWSLGQNLVFVSEAVSAATSA